MDNPELVLQSLEHFPKLMNEGDYNIPMELEDYIHYVAKTGDPVFQWTLVKPLFREKIIKVVTDFFESTPGEIPDYPNVNKFNYDIMKETLLERMDWFKGAPFTIQRISELLVNPTKEYNRVDKYMRALEKNIYVVSTREPGMPQPIEENSTTFEESFILNGNEFELKSDAEMSENKEDDEAAALLLLKKCSNSDSDDVNFNIEVDVTNTTPSDEISSEIIESSEINVQEETSEDTIEDTLNTSDSKSGQTRKHEEDDEGVEENDPKRMKLDGGDDTTIKMDSKYADELLAENEVNSEIADKSDELIEPTNEEEPDIKSKSDIDMELEETIDNKIECFDPSNVSLNVSEGDSMVISSQESSQENIGNDFGSNSEVEMRDSNKDEDITAQLPSNKCEESNADNVNTDVDVINTPNDAQTESSESTNNIEETPNDTIENILDVIESKTEENTDDANEIIENNDSNIVKNEDTPSQDEVISEDKSLGNLHETLELNDSTISEDCLESKSEEEINKTVENELKSFDESEKTSTNDSTDISSETKEETNE